MATSSPAPSSTRRPCSRVSSSSGSAAASRSCPSIAMAWSTSTPSAGRSSGRPCSSASCTPTTKSARCSRSARSPRSPTSRRAGAHRCGPVAGQDAGQRQRAGRRSTDGRRAQAVRAQGRRRAVRAAWRGAGAVDPRRRPRGRSPGGDGERAVPRRRWARRAEMARASLPAATERLRQAPRPALGPAARGARRARRAQRPSRAAAAEHAQRQLRRPRRGGAAGRRSRRSPPRPARPATRAPSACRRC